MNEYLPLTKIRVLFENVEKNIFGTIYHLLTSNKCLFYTDFICLLE
ncbi:MAG: hypothetical protein CM1200mP28_16380 [Deltaproteobacteria bacterium]|nr:MAG: hypothetical protein CM1200mP28_16380 [Deltaproteobacteria bacterium]